MRSIRYLSRWTCFVRSTSATGLRVPGALNAGQSPKAAPKAKSLGRTPHPSSLQLLKEINFWPRVLRAPPKCHQLSTLPCHPFPPLPSASLPTCITTPPLLTTFPSSHSSASICHFRPLPTPPTSSHTHKYHPHHPVSLAPSRSLNIHIPASSLTAKPDLAIVCLPHKATTVQIRHFIQHDPNSQAKLPYGAVQHERQDRYRDRCFRPQGYGH